MTMIRNVAVIDIGKTNAKLAVVDLVELAEIAVVTRPNRTLTGPPWPHFDVDGHWSFLLDALAGFHAAHGIDAISVTTHGACGALIAADGQLAAPILDYEHDGPDTLKAQYDAIRPAFSETGSPRLPAGLNLGAQLHWQFKTDASLRDRTRKIVTYPQFWGHRLTGVLASDITSLGCHTDLWNPTAGTFSTLVERLGIADKMAPPCRPTQILGQVSTAVAERTGILATTPVACGIHDSNASLYPYLSDRTGAFSVVSTGTWVVVMSIGGDVSSLDPERDTLINVNALGQAVPTARFMGGREFETVRRGREIIPSSDDRAAVLDGIHLLPAIQSGSGPFPRRRSEWCGPRPTDAQEVLALSWYLALMTDTCLTLTGARGPVIVEGPFSRNIDFLEMLAALRPQGVEVSESSTGTSIGAATLFLKDAAGPATRRIEVKDPSRLQDYAARWNMLLDNDRLPG